ncbi:unnamed protein product [Chondrus crispus]|uniref:Uncharacterized protein n=1 Tax=Chondrus crispus TaxID=2769 RepID=R7QG68_CHOCR|nr:unnamed protein product [Chondrus crispus]CDF37497.1 unnamed protein product [Chondrus crispus]|eukprot:XP_005717368.1 unnamed protein product [Chondrus crispus]
MTQLQSALTIVFCMTHFRARQRKRNVTLRKKSTPIVTFRSTSISKRSLWTSQEGIRCVLSYLTRT